MSSVNTSIKKYLSISEASKILEVSIKTLRRWDKSGILKSVRLDGKNRYFSLDDIQKLKINKPLSISETAQKLGLSVPTLRRMDKKGLITGERNNRGERIFTKESIEQYINDKKNKKKLVDIRLPEAPISEAKIEEVKVEKTTEELPLNQFARRYTYYSRFLSRENLLHPFHKYLPLMLVGLFLTFFSLLVLGLFKGFNYINEANNKKEGIKQSIVVNRRIESPSAVLAASIKSLKGLLTVNLPALFNNDVTFKKGISVAGMSAFAGDIQYKGKIIDLESLSTSALNGLTAGSGVSVTTGQKPTITNTDLGSSQKIFKTIKAGSDSFSAGSNTDTLEFAGGTGITLSTDTTNKKLTISGLAASGWTDDGTVVRLNTSTDKVGIGTSTPGSLFTVGDNAFTVNSSGQVTAGTWQGSAVGATYGGTGLTSYITGNLIYASATNTLAKLTIGTANQVLTVVSGVPAWADASGGVSSINSLTGGLTIAGGGINAISSSGTTVTITGTEADTLATVTGRGATTTTAVTFSSTINSNTFTSTALTFAGASPNISASTAGTNINLNAGTSGKVVIAGTSTGDVDIAGGSTDTGCTISNSTGALTCSGDINGGSTGTAGFWTRTGTSLAPATAGDSITTTGAISTTGTGTLSIAGSATFSSTINSNTFNSTALTFAGTTPVISASSAATSLTVNPGAGGSLNLAGGSGSTGCTVDDTTGDLTCTGTIASGGGGDVGFWKRNSGTNTVSPVTTGDHIATSGNITAEGTGTITSGGLLTGQAGLTVTGGIASINATSDYTTNINTGTSTGAISIGNSLAGAITLQSGAASTFAAPANTATAFRFTDGTNAYQTLDTRNTLSGVSAFTFTSGTAPSIASASNAEYTTLTTTPPTITLTGTTQITSQMDSILFNAPTLTDSSALTVDKAATLTINGAPISGATGSVTLTDSYSLKINTASVDTGTGTVTNAYGLYVDAPTGAGTNNYMAYFNSANTSGTDFKINNTGVMTGTVASLVADSLTSGTLLDLSVDGLAGGKGINLASTSTALTSGNLLNIDWSPTGSTNIYATGDLMSVGTGNAYAFVGNLFNVKNQGSSVFSVSDTAVTAGVPASFTAPGDVSIAYDINMTNPTASYIKSNAPLYITAGKVFNSSDLTLTTYNQGSIILYKDFAGSAVTNYLSQITGADTTANANTNYGLYSSITHTGNAAKTGVGLYSTLSTSSTTADTLIAADLATSTTGVITTGTRSIYGLRSQPASTAASTGGTTNVYGLYSKPGGVVGAGGTINSYGLYVANGTMDTTGTSTNYGIYVESPTGADTNYPITIAAISGTGTAAGITTGAISATGATAYHLNLGAISGANATSHTAINVGNISGATTDASGITLGTLTGGTTTNYQISTGVLTSATTTTNAQLNLGGVVTTGGTTNYGINVGALSGTGTTNYGVNINTLTSVGTTNYGTYIGGATGAATNNYGLYVGAVSGAGTGNFSIYTNAGTAGFGGNVIANNTSVVAGTLNNTTGGTCGTQSTSTTLALLQTATAVTSSHILYNSTRTKHSRITSVTTCTDGAAATWQVITLTDAIGSQVATDAVTVYNPVSDIGNSVAGFFNNVYGVNGKFVASTVTGGFDIAEQYPTKDSSLEAGDVVAVDPNSTFSSIIKSSFPYQKEVLGIISTNPGLTLGDEKDNNDTYYKKVALSGKVPVKVSLENGNITAGDYLTSSSIPGVAMKSTKPGQIIGKALENYSNGNIGIILVFINISFADPQEALVKSGGSQSGDLAEYYPYESGVDAIAPEEGDIISISNPIKYGSAKAFLVEKAKKSYENKTIGVVSNTAFQTMGKGILEWSDHNVLVGLVGRVAVKISPDSSEIQPGDLLTSSDDSGKAKKANKDGYVLGKALESWTKNSGKDKILVYLNQSVNIDKILADTTSPSATLGASLVSTQQSDIDLLKARVDFLESQMGIVDASSSAQVLSAATSSNIASTSAELKLDQNLTLTKDLTVTGKTNLYDLGVTGDITAGLLVINGMEQTGGSSISTLSGPLRLQVNSLGPVEIMDGKVVIDRGGNIKVQSITASEYKGIAGKNIGSGKILAGTKSIDIPTPLVTPGSRILITTTTETSYILSISSKIAGEKFVVSTTTPVDKDITFDWFMINEGN